ncbi:Hint domain-containing protein [Acetobacteraceae bacterium KSS8]|uniref:Hint domain-containing protein n=1 Tax=Endosaccharibacter trunci TaxID=2812733 RepID=A0ABT1W8M2_9PROT|nr:Hint domain-containing protein [Acetobacteraceae bacterium KSS8]
MSTIFANGTIAAGTTLTGSSGLDQLGASPLSTITNNGTVLFAETGVFAPQLWFYGNLLNNGVISASVAAPTGGATVQMGAGSTSSLLNNTGTISINDSNAISGATLNLFYGSINNTGTLSATLSGASTVNWYNANVSNGGSVLISSTGATGATVDLGGALLTMANTGSFTVNEGGASSGSTFNSFYGQLNNSGTYNFTASSGPGGATSHWFNTVNNSGTMNLASNNNGRTIENASGFDGTLNNNGALNISGFDVYANQLAGTGTVNLGSHGDFRLLATTASASGQTINFSTVSNNGTLILDGTNFAGKIRGFGTGDHIDLSLLAPFGVNLAYNGTTGMLSVSPLFGSTYITLDVGLGYTASAFQEAANFDDGLLGTQITYNGTAPCFLPGTLIATPQGERPVEEIVAGDAVLTLSGDRLVPATVRWTGSRTLRVRPGIDPLDAYPVRIRRSAFAPGAPHKDLLVTSEHCVLVDGRLVPARMLVNGGSIVVDTTITCYSFHHVELDRHAILMSDGLATESYLDTGNRSMFAQSERPALHPDFALAPAHASWDDAAAPLATDASFVRPVWERLAERAALMGHTLPSRLAPVSDADPHLLTEAGERLDPVLADGSVLAFVVPAGAGRLYLASRAARPSDVIGPFLDDRRALGVKVGRIGVAAGRDRCVLGRDASAQGWHDGEADGCWTDGRALLPVEASEGKALYLDIEIVAVGLYPAVVAPEEVRLAA